MWLSFSHSYSLVIWTQLIATSFISIASQSNKIPAMTSRMGQTERPYIEDVLDEYGSLPNLRILALGSSHWGPPKESLEKLIVNEFEVQKYGSIMGYDPLRQKLKSRLQARGLDLTKRELIITAGANQAFLNVALALSDVETNSIVVAPYYFSHKMSLQLAGSRISVAPFDPSTLLPNWETLEDMILTFRPNMVVITTPNNPSGKVWSRADIERIVELCRATNTWLVIDQTYCEFHYEGSKHFYPCSKVLNYDNIIHIFSFSKNFGMPGWRVGYLVFPDELTDSFRKIQDAVPTCATILSQKLALHCLEVDDSYYDASVGESSSSCSIASPISGDSKNEELNDEQGLSSATGRGESDGCSGSHMDEVDGGRTWVQSTVSSLEIVRAALLPVLESVGTVRTTGAFYFLVPVPPEVTEEEAVDILARQHGVLLMPGTPFGAPQHMRLSYGSLPPASSLAVVDQLRDGLQHLADLARSRRPVLEEQVSAVAAKSSFLEAEDRFSEEDR